MKKYKARVSAVYCEGANVDEVNAFLSENGYGVIYEDGDAIIADSLDEHMLTFRVGQYILANKEGILASMDREEFESLFEEV